MSLIDAAIDYVYLLFRDNASSIIIIKIVIFRYSDRCDLQRDKNTETRNAICGFHDGVRGVRFLEHGTVIPHGAGAIRGDGLYFALPDAAEHGAFGGVGEEGGNLCRLVCASAEMRGIIERTGVGAARNLIPLASVRSCDKRVRARRLIKLDWQSLTQNRLRCLSYVQSPLLLSRGRHCLLLCRRRHR